MGFLSGLRNTLLGKKNPQAAEMNQRMDMAQRTVYDNLMSEKYKPEQYAQDKYNVNLLNQTAQFRPEQFADARRALMQQAVKKGLKNTSLISAQNRALDTKQNLYSQMSGLRQQALKEQMPIDAMMERQRRSRMMLDLANSYTPASEKRVGGLVPGLLTSAGALVGGMGGFMGGGSGGGGMFGGAGG